MCILGKGGEREWDWRFGVDEQMREREEDDIWGLRENRGSC
jgi:hypothetical protein